MQWNPRMAKQKISDWSDDKEKRSDWSDEKEKQLDWSDNSHKTGDWLVEKERGAEWHDSRKIDTLYYYFYCISLIVNKKI